MTDPLGQEIDRARQRAAHYWVQDGLGEIVGGLFMVVIAACVALEGVVTPGSWWETALAVGLPIALIGLGLWVRRVVLALKDRYVHPRTGRVVLTPPGRGKKLQTAALGFVFGVLFSIVSQAASWRQWWPALAGVVFCTALLIAGRRTNLARFPVEGVLAVAGGIGVSLLRLDDTLAIPLVLGMTGLLMAVGGAVAFRAYLRQAPPAEGA